MKKLPDFIIIGAMKCATSSLHEQLALQSGIFMSELKEPNFFSDDDQYQQGIDWYLSHFKEAKPDDLCGESSTHYTKLPTYPQTIQRLQKYLPDAKFIYVMRHPIDRLVSQYTHEWSQRVISVEINEAIEKHPELIDYSLYTKQLKPYFDTFGQDKILPIFFERMLTYPQEELERICQFIGYPNQPQWDVELNASNVSSERMIKSGWRDAIVETPGLKQLRQWLIPKTFRNWVRSLWTMKQKPELTPENIDKLQAIFEQDLALLGTWLGTELSCTNFKETVKMTPVNWVK
ncbi:sulfotransferase [Crocosphaera sp. UHCC 0190]|uniref:sulfotransferase family protein n=1 Tax=Crocosphaera sp. UHCC 0190 TaxID=3110246 RepID=UPI002B20F116|nr:sulfotransferase [Crocosphaera sp. UHCC 0190]MEA5510787.1 sulfotransferase [Crocosphaera sp. UHCC 0190]